MEFFSIVRGLFPPLLIGRSQDRTCRYKREREKNGLEG